MPTRAERLNIEFEVNKDQFDALKKEFTVICPQVMLSTFYQNDTFKVTYAFDIEYFGRVQENLEAICKIIETPGVVLKSSHKEMLHSKCLVEQVFLKLQAIERLLKIQK